MLILGIVFIILFGSLLFGAIQVYAAANKAGLDGEMRKVAPGAAPKTGLIGIIGVVIGIALVINAV